MGGTKAFFVGGRNNPRENPRKKPPPNNQA